MKFRCARDSFINERNTPRRYGYSTRPAFRLTKRCLVSFRENGASARWGKFRRRYQRESRKGCTRAPIPRSTRPCLIVPPVSILHTSLSNAEWLIGKQREVPTGSNVHTAVCFPRSGNSMPSCSHEFVKAHGHSVPWNRSAAIERRGQKSRKIFIARDNARFLMRGPIVAARFFSPIPLLIF